jgi:hypothetical protein
LSAEQKQQDPIPDFQLAFIRWSVVHRSWHDLCGGIPSLEGFLAGWFCRVCEAEPPVVVGRFRDSFNCGWREAHEQIVILSRQVDTNDELLSMLKRFAERGEHVWDDENFRDGYKKIPSGDLVDCRELLRKYGVENFNE